MADNLWKLRQLKGLSVAQLAARSGVAAKMIEAYERGEPVRSSDLARLARALYVDADAIRLRSEPAPEQAPRAPRGSPAAPRPAATAPAAPAAMPAAGAASGAEAVPPEAPPARKAADKQGQAPAPQSAPARPGQITQMIATIEKMGVPREALEREVGKPLDALSFLEARHWLGVLYQRRREYVPAASPVDRHRPHLPEGVEEYEMDYLFRAQTDRAVLEFTLFDGQRVSGRVLGFSAYFITIQLGNGDELTLQKLAIAYYRRPA